MASYLWLEQWGKTPMDLGLAPEEVDPAWQEAMLILKNGFEEERRNLNSR